MTNFKYQISNLGQRTRELAAKSWRPFLFVVAIVLVVLMLGWYWPPEKLVFPFTYIQSWKYQWLASRLPAGDVKAERFRAIAEALRQGKTEYEFETGPLPAQ